MDNIISSQYYEKSRNIGVIMELIYLIPLWLIQWNNVNPERLYHPWDIYDTIYYSVLVPVWLLLIVIIYTKRKDLFIFLYVFIIFQLLSTCYTFIMLIYSIYIKVDVSILIACNFMLLILVIRLIVWLIVSSTITQIRRDEMLKWRNENR
jgi:hypothetical protein